MAGTSQEVKKLRLMKSPSGNFVVNGKVQNVETLTDGAG